MSTAPGIRTRDDFFAHALAIEREAATRYLQFAEQMVLHDNPEVARLFEDLAQLESAHHAALQRRALAHPGAAMRPWGYAWIDPESPESAPLDAVHYLMTPWHALRIALVNELRAQRFFEAIAASPDTDDDVRRLATEFAAEEHEHAGCIEEKLAAMPPPDLVGATDSGSPAPVA